MEKTIVVFNTQQEALDFLFKARYEKEVRALYYPTGGDNPKTKTVDPTKHKVMVLNEKISKV